MFSFNAGHRVPTLKEAHKWWQYEPKGTAIIKFLSSIEESKPRKDDEAKEAKEQDIQLEERNHAAQDPFMDPLNEELLDIDLISESLDARRASRGLPPEFIRKWCLDKVFTKVEELVDFSQALTGIDYLQDLECRRREALREVALRLKIEKNNWRKVLSSDPDAKKWVEDIQAQETIIEGFYATCFVDLRIWTMLHELKTKPFYKPNVLAMLNTLYPPCIKELPNSLIDLDKLRKHRAKFYNFVIEVERKDTSVLKEFELLLKNPDCKHNWVDTRENLKDYIELASKMIEQSNAIHDIGFFKESAAIAYSLRSRHSRSTTASSNISTRTARQGSQNQDLVVAKSVPFGPERAAARHRSKSITDSVQSKGSPPNIVASNFSGGSQSSKVEGRSQIRKRLASPKRQHEYSQEYCTVPMNPPRVSHSIVTTPDLHQKQSFSNARPSDGDRNFPVLENQYRRPRANTPFTEKNSEAAQHQSFQSWVPLKYQHQMSPFRQISYPDPFSRGPPNPKYQLPPKKLCEEEKLLQALRRPEVPIRRRASFSDEIPSSSLRERASSNNSTKTKPRRMHRGSGATSSETLRAGSSYISQQSFSTKSDKGKQAENTLKNNSSSPQAYGTLDLRELPRYPTISQTASPEITHRPQLRTQNSYGSSGSSGGLRSRAMSGFSSIPGSPLALQHDMPEPSAAPKLQLRRTPLRDPSTAIPELSRMKLRKKPLHESASAETHTPGSPLVNPLSPLLARQESPITPTPGNHLRKTALHNSSIGIQTRNASQSVSKSPFSSPLNPTTPSPRMDVYQDGKQPAKPKHSNHIQSDSLSGSSRNNMSSNTGEHTMGTPVRKPTLPGLSPDADLSFLDSPYEPPEEIRPKLKKKSSMATIIRRKSSDSLKSVRFEEPESIHENANSTTQKNLSESSKIPKKSSGGNKSSSGTSFNDNALGISIPGVRSTTALAAATGGSFMNFPPPPQPKPVLKQQKSLGLFPRREGGKDKSKATKSAPTSKSKDMGGVFDGSQHACTAYCAHTAIACREPYRFPVPPNRVPITQESVQKSDKLPTAPSRSPIINNSLSERHGGPSPSTRTPNIDNLPPKSKPMISVNTTNQSFGTSNSSPISPANKVFGFIPPPLPPPLKGVITNGDWESDLDIALAHEHRIKLEYAQSQQHPALRTRASPGLTIDTVASNDSHQMLKTTSKLSKTTSLANDTPNLPPLIPASGKFGSFFMNAGANISAIFVGKNALDTPDPSKPPKLPVSILSKSDAKDRSGKLHGEKAATRKERAGTITNFLHTLRPSHIFKKSHRNPHKSSLIHKHKLISYRKREALLRRHLRIKADTMQRYRRMVLLEDSQQMVYAEGLKWIHRCKPFLRESPEEYRRREYLREWMLELSRGEKEGMKRPRGTPFLADESVRRGVRKVGRDARRRFFEGFVGPGVEGRGQVERVLEKIDWRKEGWFVAPKARVERGEKGETLQKKYVMISTEKYRRY
ncbi:hypothetical protein EYC84_008790 [Monilinia fructicola]|uniref:Uncharacterized protein n=1 Tax=Monilinia fructicola TaxID=38448 RepID=A0A5M9J985_MONFR|nr:hypothetical protein EYC84_008790 [Monilinia fructicola]